jgi:hypothetical protein
VPQPFYNGLANAPDKALVVLEDADHFTFANNFNAAIAEYSIAWMKRFLDSGTRYDQFLCPTPSNPNVASFSDTCPL